MKTYFFLIVLFLGSLSQTFAAQDASLPAVTLVHQQATSITLNHLETIDNQAKNQLSWKEKVALKIIKKKIAKAERKIKQGKKTNVFGGLIALIVIGLLLIPLGAIILIPLLIVGIVLLALGIVGTVLGGLGSIFW
jgi:Flp pilus assembly protein TadB